MPRLHLELRTGNMIMHSAVSDGDSLSGVDARAALATGGLVALGVGAIAHGFSLVLGEGPLDGLGPWGFGEMVGGAAAVVRALQDWGDYRAVMGLWRTLAEESGEEREGGQGRAKIRVVPVYRAGTSKQPAADRGVDPADLRYFVEQILVRGHRERDWLGADLPSGARITSWRDWDRFISLLEQAGLYEGRSPRRSGRLTTDNVAEMLKVLGLWYD